MNSNKRFFLTAMAPLAMSINLHAEGVNLFGITDAQISEIENEKQNEGAGGEYPEGEEVLDQERADTEAAEIASNVLGLPPQE